jgi:hypothetical protein
MGRFLTALFNKEERLQLRADLKQAELEVSVGMKVLLGPVNKQ